MHPPLHRPHPDCQEVVSKLLQCHEDNPFGKFLGACNEHKYALDRCFKAEKEKKRAANAQAARDRRAKFESAKAESAKFSNSPSVPQQE